MGMSIEEFIEGLHDKDNKSVDFAIDTMRKYEEIEKIVEDRNGKPPLTTLNEIIMVVEEWTYYKKKVRENKDEV